MTDLDILNKIDCFVELYPGSDFSFAHIVLSDYNLLDRHIQLCIEQKSEWVVQKLRDGNDKMAVAATANSITMFLHELLKIPEERRIAEMQEYFGESVDWMQEEEDDSSQFGTT